MRIGSGLEELFEPIYSEDSVKNIFSGKAVARALQAHMLTQSAWISHLLNSLVDGGGIDLSDLEKNYNKTIEMGMTENDTMEMSADYEGFKGKTDRHEKGKHKKVTHC